MTKFPDSTAIYSGFLTQAQIKCDVVISKRRYFTQLCFVLTFILSAMVLIGWQFNISLLKTLLPGRPDMKANAAICFLFLGMGIALTQPRISKSLRHIGKIFSLFVFIYSGIVLFEYIYHVTFFIDELFFIDPNGMNGHSPPGRYSSMTALNFFVLSLAVLISGARPWCREKTAQAIAMLVFMVALLSFLGNALGSPNIFGMGVFMPMAIHTGFIFVVLSSAFLSARWELGLMKTFSAPTLSAVMARQMFLAVLAVPLFIRIITATAEAQGLFTYEVGVFLRVLGGQIFMAVIVLSSAAALWRAEQASRKFQKDLELAKVAAEEASLAKSQFLANMSHEIRTPLGVILGFSDLALEGVNQPEEVQDYLQTIRRNANELSNLIGDILDLSKVEANKLEIEEIEFPLKPLLDEVITSLSASAKEKNLRLSLKLEGQLPARIISDHTRLRQILVNLLVNAIKFTHEGQVELKVSAVQGSPNLLSFKVTDSGIGVSTNHKDRLFKAFSQADSSMTRKFGGTGLGLMLSKQLAQALGGDLALVSSEVGVGSVFEATIAIRTATKAKAPMPSPPTPVETPKNQDLQNLQILLVEDVEENQRLVEAYLKNSGVVLTIADDGERAIEYAAGNDFDAILMDIQMPKMDGYRATTLLRENGFTKPIIALTAHAIQHEREKALALGFNGYLTKPLSRDVLLKTLSDLRT